MPRFNEHEKMKIEQSLLDEGERLFTIYGLKKVTIDDIVKSVNIAKATFYKFYEGKEYLFLDIVQRQQKEIYEILEGIMTKSESRTDRERVKNVFFEMSKLVSKYPLLTSIDEDTVKMITRKVSAERLEKYSKQGFDAVKTIENHGIAFRYDTQIISQVFHALYESWIKLQEQPEEMQKKVIDIMLEGILQQII